jgi:hypothetical protein
MGHYKNTDNLGTTLQIGDRVGYIFGCAGHYRIHSGIVGKLCEKRVWIKPDEDFEDDVRYKQSKKELYKKSISKYDEFICIEYGKVVKL